MGPIVNFFIHAADDQSESPRQPLAGEARWHTEIYRNGRDSEFFHSLVGQRKSGRVSLGGGALVKNARVPARRCRVLPGRVVVAASSQWRTGDAYAFKP